MKVLVDTSVWSLALRRTDHGDCPEAVELRRLVADHRVVLLGAIRQELLSGVKAPAQFDRLETRLAAFPDVALRTEDHVNAAKFFNLCRAHGLQGSNTDFLICAVAVSHDFAIFTTDGDFARLAKYLPIILHEFN